LISSRSQPRSRALSLSLSLSLSLYLSVCLFVYLFCLAHFVFVCAHIQGGSESVTEDIAEYVWNCLHCIKAQLSKYGDGKLSKEEVFYNNQKYIRKLSKMIAERYVHTSALLTPPPISDMDWIKSEDAIQQRDLCSEGVPFEDLAQQYRRLKRVMYILKLDSLVYVYVPSTCERKIRQMGLPQDKRSVASLPRDVVSPRSLSIDNSPLSEHHIEKRMYYVKLQLMCSVNEWALFVVKRGVSLQGLLDYVCDLPNSGTPGDSEVAKKSAKRGLFNSFTRTTTKAMKMPTRYVDGSKNFTTELTNMLSLCDSLAPGRHVNRSTSGDQNMLMSGSFNTGVTISLAIKTRQGQDSYLSPMTGNLDQTFEQCFAMEDTSASNPLSLHIFVTSSTPPVTELVSSASHLSSDQFEFSKDTLDYIAALITGATMPFEDDPASLKQMVEGLFASVCWVGWSSLVANAAHPNHSSSKSFIIQIAHHRVYVCVNFFLIVSWFAVSRISVGLQVWCPKVESSTSSKTAISHSLRHSVIPMHSLPNQSLAHLWYVFDPHSYRSRINIVVDHCCICVVVFDLQSNHASNSVGVGIP
jgi:hypothetical protein